jgi:hypothetical protein
MGSVVQKIINIPCTTAPPPPDKSNVNDDEIDVDVEDEDKVGNSAARINAAIADVVNVHGLPFTLGETARFRHFIRLENYAPPNYEPPKRKLVVGQFVTANQEEYMRSMYDQLALQADTFGLCLLGDRATAKHIPLENVSSAGVHDPVGVLEIAECTGHIESGGKKYAIYIANLFLNIWPRLTLDK